MGKPDTATDAELTSLLRELGLKGNVHAATWSGTPIGASGPRLFGYVWTHAPNEDDAVLARSEPVLDWSHALDYQLRQKAREALKKAAEPPPPVKGPILERLR